MHERVAAVEHRCRLHEEHVAEVFSEDRGAAAGRLDERIVVARGDASSRGGEERRERPEDEIDFVARDQALVVRDDLIGAARVVHDLELHLSTEHASVLVDLLRPELVAAHRRLARVGEVSREGERDADEERLLGRCPVRAGLRAGHECGCQHRGDSDRNAHARSGHRIPLRIQANESDRQTVGDDTDGRRPRQDGANSALQVEISCSKLPRIPVSLSDKRNACSMWEPIEKRNTYELVAEQLLADIGTRLQPGDTVPTERELTASFKVGRSSVREAPAHARVQGRDRAGGQRQLHRWPSSALR